MTIYRLESCSCHMGSEGFTYFRNQAELQAAVSELKAAGYTEEEGGCVSADAGYTIETAQTPRTKADIVELLNRWAAHPDNG
jgi:hypothetical protein